MLKYKNILQKFKSTVVIVLICILFLPQSLLAIEFDENFTPNKIISDFLMFRNTNSMSLEDIQRFLEDKNSFLANYKTEDWNGEIKSAARIIYEAAQTYDINPKVLLVLLQKEQGLIQKKNPSQKSLDWATGYAVCDGCSKKSKKVQKYKGFGKQIDNAAGALRFYKENMFKYKFIKNINQEYIIDGQKIIPENYATAVLYTYTPHILGNYNFWRIWQRYFGNPLAETIKDEKATIQTDYMAQIIDSAPLNLKVDEGKTAYYWVEFLNIGTRTWDNRDLRSVYLLNIKKKDLLPIISENSHFDPIAVEDKISDKDKIFAPKRIIKPGEVLRITIPIKAKNLKTESEKYILVIDGKGWLPGTEVSYKLTRRFKFDGILIDDSMPEYSPPNTLHRLKVQYKNVGLKTWYDDEVFLDWNDKTKKIRAKIPMDQKKVKPGEIATFSLITKIRKPAVYNYELKLVRKVSKRMFVPFLSGSYKTKILARQGLAAKIIDFQVPERMSPGEIYYARILVKNVGGKTWYPQDKTALRSYSTISPYTRSRFYNKSWYSGFTIEKIKRPVKPGEGYTFLFKIVAPKKSGVYKHYFQIEWGDKYQEILLDGKYYTKLVTTIVSDKFARR